MNGGDLRQAMRSLARRPVFATAAVVTMALGIGANAAVYRVVRAVLLEDLPFRDPQRLVQLWERTPVLPHLQVSVPDFEDWRGQTRGFAAMSAYTFQAINHITLIAAGDPQVVQATNATADLFSTMGIRPLLGHAFDAADDSRRRNAALISEQLWRTTFAADPAIVGRALRLETESFTVIGVVPARQAFPPWADVWLPFSWMDDNLRSTRKYHPVEVVARLRPGVTQAAADDEIRALATRLAAEHRDSNGTLGAFAIPLDRQITGDARPALLLVWTAVGLVLLMACANLGHMLLARMLDRRQEMAIRTALGAGRSGLVRLVFTESLLLAAAGGICGALVAFFAGGLLTRMAQGRIPRLENIRHGGAVPLFIAALSIVCGLIFGVPACAQVLHVDAMPSAGRSGNRRRSPLGALLIASEVALAFVVLMAATLLLRSFAVLLNEDPGFRADHVLAVELPLPSSRYDSAKAARFFQAQIQPAVQALPGVQEVAAANCAPLSLGLTEHTRYATRFGIEGRTFEAGRYPVAQFRWVSPEYFDVLKIPLLSGRRLTEADRDQARYLINETLARRFFPNSDPTTHRLILGVMDPQKTPVEIAGVVGDVRDLGLDEPAPPTLYFISSSPYMTLLVRTAGDPLQLSGAIRQAIHRADAEVAVVKMAPVEQYVADSLARRRFALTLLAAFAVLAALLTTAGVYGLMAYSVSARIRECGIRAALGATPGNLFGMVMREGLAVMLPGWLAGVAIGLAGARLIRSMLYRISPLDPASLGGVAAVLIFIVTLAVWAPAVRAARVDAGTALHEE